MKESEIIIGTRVICWEEESIRGSIVGEAFELRIYRKYQKCVTVLLDEPLVDKGNRVSISYVVVVLASIKREEN